MAEPATTENAAQPCERVTVALLPDAAAALRALCGRTRRNKTDLVNRAVMLYEFADAQVAAGAAVLIRHPDGSLGEVRFL